MLFDSIIFNLLPAAVGIMVLDLPSLLNGLLSNPDIDADSAENSVE